MISAELEELEKSKGHRCLWCLVTAYQSIDGRLVQYLFIYQSEASRLRGLRYYQREGKLTNEVYFTFEIPIDIYLEGAQKYI